MGIIIKLQNEWQTIKENHHVSENILEGCGNKPHMHDRIDRPIFPNDIRRLHPARFFLKSFLQ